MITKPKIFVVDIDEPFLRSLSALAASMDLPVHAFSSGEQFFREFDPLHPGCLILESRIPDLSGLEIQERLSREEISPPVIFVASQADIPTVVRAKRFGAINFLLKDCFSETELWESINIATDRDRENRIRYTRRQMLLNKLKQLSSTERQVLDMLLAGKNNSEIAETLGVNRRAAESRRARLMRKLEVDNLTGLVRFAIDTGLYNSPNKD